MKLVQILHQLVRLLHHLVVRLAQLLVQQLALGLVVLLELIDRILQVSMVFCTCLLLQFRLQIVSIYESFDLPLQVVELFSELKLPIIERLHLLPFLLVVAEKGVIHLDLQLLLQVVCGYKFFETCLDPLVKVVVYHIPNHLGHVLLQRRNFCLCETVGFIYLPSTDLKLVDLDLVLLCDFGFECLDL